MKVLFPADQSEANFVRDVDAVVSGLPVRGVNGPGDNPPIIDTDPPGVNGSLGRGWTRWRAQPFAVDAQVVFELTETFEERITISTPELRDWLASKGYTVTTAQAARLRALVAAAGDVAVPTNMAGPDRKS